MIQNNEETEVELFIDPDEERMTFNYNQIWNCFKSASEASSFEDLKNKSANLKATFDEKCGFD